MPSKNIGEFKIPANMRRQGPAATFGGRSTHKLEKVRDKWTPYVEEYGREVFGHKFGVASTWRPHEGAIGFDVVVDADVGGVAFEYDNFVAWYEKKYKDRIRPADESGERVASGPVAPAGASEDACPATHDEFPTGGGTGVADTAEVANIVQTDPDKCSSGGVGGIASSGELSIPSGEGSTELRAVHGQPKEGTSSSGSASLGSSEFPADIFSARESQQEATVQDPPRRAWEDPAELSTDRLADIRPPPDVSDPNGSLGGPRALPPRAQNVNKRIETFVESVQAVWVIRTGSELFATPAEGSAICEGQVPLIDNSEIGSVTLEDLQIVRDLEVIKKQLKF